MRRVGMLLALVCAHAFAQELPVPILTTVDADTFPASWTDGDVAAVAEALPREFVEHSTAVLEEGLRKYPQSLLKANLKRVCLLKSVRFYGLEYGGTNSRDTVYITNQGPDKGYTDEFIEGALHHEFSSILLRNYGSKFDAVAWTKSNPEGFRYGQGGVEALKSGHSSTAIDRELCRQGFLTQYSVASIEEDFNMIAENLFLGRKSFWLAVRDSPLLEAKVDLAMAFYEKLDPMLTKAHFQAIADAAGSH